MEVHPRIDLTIAARRGLGRRRRLPLSGRVRARIFTTGLDRDLAAGADPAGDPTLTLRAQHLRSAHVRRQLAAGLRDTVRRAHRPSRLSAAAPISRTAVRENESLLDELADRLDSEPAAEAGGIAAANLLLTDGTSPLWVNGDPGELHDLLGMALFRLGRAGGGPR